ncbi:MULTISPECIES: hypothetical protein [Halomonas]|uniref:hypothetical protein n=1 Tax=Halomonas TaxID=2745 RepID=UPI001C98B8BB|nr:MULTISPECIES: hypothetical protein [Halomonas]MBY6208728.1 hypothetical protein [Halomonas sp. DP3Y7-2]MBY6227199.1 hypothetical protein [Halomonas sp. DP3Y7-1]MCA0915052.1 hypothetical protein [Halomonas denitrificans]
MSFLTHVAGIPCRCEVTHYSKPTPMRITGWGFGDAEPPETGEFEYRILDRRGRHAPWLEAKLVEADDDRLLEEYLALQNRAA